MTNEFRLHLELEDESMIPEELINEVIESTDWCEHEEFMAEEEREYLEGKYSINW